MNVLMQIAEHLARGEGSTVVVDRMLADLGLAPSAARRIRDLKAFGWVLDTYKTSPRVAQGSLLITKVGRMPGTNGEPMSVSGHVKVSDVGLETLTKDQVQRFRTYLRDGLQEDPAAEAYRRFQRLSPAAQQRVKGQLLDLLD